MILMVSRTGVSCIYSIAVLKYEQKNVFMKVHTCGFLLHMACLSISSCLFVSRSERDLKTVILIIPIIFLMNCFASFIVFYGFLSCAGCRMQLRGLLGDVAHMLGYGCWYM